MRCPARVRMAYDCHSMDRWKTTAKMVQNGGLHRPPEDVERIRTRRNILHVSLLRPGRRRYR